VTPVGTIVWRKQPRRAPAIKPCSCTEAGSGEADNERYDQPRCPIHEAFQAVVWFMQRPDDKYCRSVTLV
jgi:hypothetical protein